MSSIRLVSCSESAAVVTLFFAGSFGFALTGEGSGVMPPAEAPLGAVVLPMGHPPPLLLLPPQSTL